MGTAFRPVVRQHAEAVPTAAGDKWPMDEGFIRIRGAHTSFAARSTSMGTSATVSGRANAAASTPVRRFVRHYMGRTRSHWVGRLRSNNFLSTYLPQPAFAVEWRSAYA